MTDWRLPENRREAFLRCYGMNLEYKAEPDLVYSWVPAIVERYGMDDDAKVWFSWLITNVDNPPLAMMLFEAAPDPRNWMDLLDYVSTNYTRLQWDPERLRQKSHFGDALEDYILNGGIHALDRWKEAAEEGWEAVWDYAISTRYFGRLAAWSIVEYMRILLPWAPDMGTFFLNDATSSRSVRNGLLQVLGYEAVKWKMADVPMSVIELEIQGSILLEDARARFPEHKVDRMSMESDLCAFKSWFRRHRYPGVYADEALDRLRDEQSIFGPKFQCLWDARKRDLPPELRAEDNPADPGTCEAKYSQFMETGVPYGLGFIYPDMMTPLELDIRSGLYAA